MAGAVALDDDRRAFETEQARRKYRSGMRLLHKPARESCSALAEVDASAVLRDVVATDRPRVTDEMAVFGAHP
jgi:hypothetical protein